MAASSSPPRTFSAAHIFNFQRQRAFAQDMLEDVRGTSAGPHLHPNQSKQLSRHSLSVLTALSYGTYILQEAVEGDYIYPVCVLANPVDDQSDRRHVPDGESADTCLTYQQLCEFVWYSGIGTVLVWDLCPYVTLPFGRVQVIRPAAAADLEVQDPRRQLLIQRISHLCELAPTQVILCGQYVQWAFSRYMEWVPSQRAMAAVSAQCAAPHTVTTFDWHVRSLQRVIHFAHCPHPSAWQRNEGRLVPHVGRVSAWAVSEAFSTAYDETLFTDPDFVSTQVADSTAHYFGLRNAVQQQQVQLQRWLQHQQQVQQQQRMQQLWEQQQQQLWEQQQNVPLLKISLSSRRDDGDMRSQDDLSTLTAQCFPLVRGVI